MSGWTLASGRVILFLLFVLFAVAFAFCFFLIAMLTDSNLERFRCAARQGVFLKLVQLFASGTAVAGDKLGWHVRGSVEGKGLCFSCWQIALGRECFSPAIRARLRARLRGLERVL